MAPPSLLPKTRRYPNEVCGIITGSEPSDPGPDVVNDDGNHDLGPKAHTAVVVDPECRAAGRNSRSRAVFSTMPIRPSPHAPHLRIPPARVRKDEFSSLLSRAR